MIPMLEVQYCSIDPLASSYFVEKPVLFSALLLQAHNAYMTH